MTDEPVSIPDGDLPQRLMAHWRAVAPRMAALPIYNPRLAVHATTFRRLDNWRIGVVTTPWFMNLTAAPEDATDLPLPGATVTLTLPAGEVDGIVAEIDGLGQIVATPLFSPMDDFADAEAATAVAEAVLDQLFMRPKPEGQAMPRAVPAAIDRRALLFPMLSRGAAP